MTPINKYPAAKSAVTAVIAVTVELKTSIPQNDKFRLCGTAGQLPLPPTGRSGQARTPFANGKLEMVSLIYRTEDIMAERTRILKSRVTPKEYNTIMENCLKSGRTVSELLRESAVEKEIIVLGGLEELATELRRQGNNLNQLTVMARQERIRFVDFKPFMEVYAKTWQALNSLLSRVV